MRVLITSAGPADLPEYTHLLQTTYQRTYTSKETGLTKDCFSPEIFSEHSTQSYLKSHVVNTPNQHTWLARQENRLIGALTCINLNENEAELTGFYVHPHFQGRGIGKKLYRQALIFAGNRDLVLDIYSHNHKTILMYQKWGWKLDKTRGENGYFYRHWPQWPKNLMVKCQYMKLHNSNSSIPIS
jgi:ribosomal protein S18 acetylase RimI-like enzyme